ncbi:MAG: mandelate racemase/muconate lactonizing enzyme family protein [Acidimicrobiia bacterium]|nr:mandelate racemase/muconate lactonizing enzyme family protein [Acidimicrobiia bacterium]
MATGNDPLDLKELRAFPLREPVSGRRYTLIRLETRGGLRGWGECAGTSDREFAQARQLLSGIPATAYDVAWRKLEPIPGLRAAINMAQLDIVGQHAKAPVYQVLGGPTRNKARALAPIEGAAPSDLLASLQKAQQAGYRAFSTTVPPIEWVNQGQAYIFNVRGRMEILRKNGGPNVDFVLDGAAQLAAGDASSIAAELEKFHLLWFDEPCRVSNLSALRKITDENVTPVGYGRNITNGGEFQDLLREEAADVLRPALYTYGVSQSRKIAALAETYYVAVAPYHDGGPVATAAALQLAASLPNFFIQQIPVPAGDADRQMRQAIAGDVERIRDGFAELPTAPGLGVQVNERALDKYRDRG